LVEVRLVVGLVAPEELLAVPENGCWGEVAEVYESVVGAVVPELVGLVEVVVGLVVEEVGLVVALGLVDSVVLRVVGAE
jgi:hypothetical protein